MTDEKIHYLSSQKLEELKLELKHLKDEKIPNIANRIDEAKQHGDLSENAEYHQAKEEMAWAHGRRQELEYIIDNAKVVENNHGKTQGVIMIGSTISIKINNKTKSYTIVGPQEADPLQGKISNESPLGEAFIGHKAGEEVVVTTPAGKQTYEILDVK